MPRTHVRTYGLTHIALAVDDVGRAVRFYEQIFGMVAVHRAPAFAQLRRRARATCWCWRNRTTTKRRGARPQV
ncbi:MAG: VOC family protein [Bauldia sp.]